MIHKVLFLSSVHSWNGNKARLDRDVENQRRQDRKRPFDDDENDLDRGRVKKVKSQDNYKARNNSNFNQFQEHQNHNWGYNNHYRQHNYNMNRPRHNGNHNRHNNRYHHNKSRNHWRR